MSADITELTTEDLAEIVRYHGANEVIDSLLLVAAEAYGDEAAGTNLHRLFLSRLRPPSDLPSPT